MRIARLTIRNLTLFSIITLGGAMLSGCLESSFFLAKDSRLPHGVAIPQGLSRADVEVRIDIHPTGATVFVVRAKGKDISKVTGKQKGNPVWSKSSPDGSRTMPIFTLVLVNGFMEVLEHKREDDILYINDDPLIRQEVVGGGEVYSSKPPAGAPANQPR